MQLIMENAALILAVLLGVSEALALIPQVKSNSIFTLVVNVLTKVKSMLPEKKK